MREHHAVEAIHNNVEFAVGDNWPDESSI